MATVRRCLRAHPSGVSHPRRHAVRTDTGGEPRRSSPDRPVRARPSLRFISSSLVHKLGEKGIFATFQENPKYSWSAIVQGFSWSLRESQMSS
jgi:hypothetical protein